MFVPGSACTRWAFCALLVLIGQPLVSSAEAQPALSPRWSQTYASEGVPSGDYATDAGSDAAGGVYVLGGTSEPHLRVWKYDAEGELLWTQSVEEEGRIIPRQIRVSADGAIHVLGEKLQRGIGTTYLSRLRGTDGALVWSRALTGLNWSDFQVDAEGRVFLTGYFSPEDPADRAHLIIQLNPDGTTRWSRSLSEENLTATRLAPDGTGGTFVGGTRGLGPSRRQPFVGHLGADGQLRWAQLFEVPTTLTSVLQVRLGESGRLYVAGSAQGYFVHAVDTSSQEALWTFHYPGTYYPTDLAVDAEDNAYVTGHAREVRFCKDECPDDFVTIKVGADGALLWEDRYDSFNPFERPTGLLVHLGQVFVAGSRGSFRPVLLLRYDQDTGERLDAWPIPGAHSDVHLARAADGLYASSTRNQPEEGANMYAMRLGLGEGSAVRGAFEQRWTRYYDGPKQSGDTAYRMDVSPSGRVVITGTSGQQAGQALQTVVFDAQGQLVWVDLEADCAGRGTAFDAAGQAAVAYQCADKRAVFVRLYDEEGHVRWTNRLSVSEARRPSLELKFDETGHLLVSLNRYLDGPEGLEEQYVLLNYAPTGEERWRTVEPQHGTGLLLDANGDVYTVRPQGTYRQDRALQTTKYDGQTGERLWVLPHDETAGFDARPKGIRGGPLGTSYTFGTRVRSMEGAWNGSGYSLTAFTADGRDQWTAFYEGLGGSSTQMASAAVGSDGDVYAAGHSMDVSGTWHLVTVKFDAQGRQQWAQAVPYDVWGAPPPAFMGVAPEGGLYVATSLSDDEDIGWFVLQYDADGEEVGRTHTGLSRITSIRVRTQGDLYVAGVKEGAYAAIRYAAGAVDVGREDEPLGPQVFSLERNYPNPFEQTTTIPYALNVPGRVELAVYDVTGRVRTVLLDEHRPAGAGSVVFDGEGLPSGVYFYRLTTPEGTQVRPMTRIR
ncbi:MAG: T9SS type A sorting domain-containing protein [Bacteroidota bacterium]